MAEARKREQGHKNPKAGDGDIKSWDNSIPVVVGELLALGLDAVQVIIEFDLPHTASAVDLVLCGVRPGTSEPSYVVVELKQIRQSTVHPDCPTAVDLGYRKKGEIEYRLHPVRQVQRYCEYMTRYLVPLSSRAERLTGVALLHNARDHRVSALFDLPETAHGALYTLDDLAAFRRLLKSTLSPASGEDAAQELVKAKTNPLPKVTDPSRWRSITDGGLVLLDEQVVGFDLIHRQVERTIPVFEDLSEDAATRTVFILRGGPGSGKSAIARELRRVLGAGWARTVLASGSRAYTETLREMESQPAGPGERKLTKRAAARNYKYFNSFSRVNPERIDVLICDEAHRIRRTSTNQWTPKTTRNEERPQIDELLQAARVTVFLLDDHQSIRPDEVGTAAYVKDFAKNGGHEVQVHELGGIFRSGGSRAYQDWVQGLLGLSETDPWGWLPDGRMQVLVANSPEELEIFIRQRHVEGLRARITAGFCWPWSEVKEGVLVPDVDIDGWRRPWNVKSRHPIADAPSASRWATDARGIDQIGCVYTAQTFEYDWNGVILGPDLVWRDGGFVVDRTASRDPAFTRATPDEAVERCIRNAYHVLLTRGMTGTVVYSPDPRTLQALRRLIPGSVTIERHPQSGEVMSATTEGNAVPKAFRKAPGPNS